MDILDKKPARKPEEQCKRIPRRRFLIGDRKKEGFMTVGIPFVFAVLGTAGFVVHPMGGNIQGVPTPKMVSERSFEEVARDFILHGGVSQASALSITGEAQQAAPKPSSANVEVGCTAQRADIVDRDGAILASSVDKAQLEFYMDVQNFDHDAERIHLARQINRIIPTKRVEDIFRLLKKKKGHFYVAHGLSPEQVQALKSEIDTKYSGMLQVTSRPSRVYPKGALFAHAVGSVRADYCPVAGLELSLNDSIVIDDGRAVQLSLDEDIQYIVMDELLKAVARTGAESAAAVLMDVHTGQIVARISVPTYDVNQKTYLSNHAPSEFKKLDKDVIFEKQEFGSVFKLYNTALALERGVGVHRFYDTTSRLRVGGFNIQEPHPDRHDLNMIGIFIRSNNRGSALMALEAGHEEQVTFLERMELVLEGELDDSGERGPASVANRAFGYGVKTSIMQLAASTASLLNGGTLVRPVYRLDENGNTGKRIFDEYNALILNRLLLTNVTHPRATGTQAHRDGVLLGLKTGTSKIHVGDGYSEDTRATVVAGFPLDKPRYSLVVSLVKPRDQEGEPMNAGTAAAPVAGNIAERIAIAEGFLRPKEFTEQYEIQHSLPYDHDPIQVAKN